MPGHYIVLRLQSGEDWDYAVIEHLGAKATVEAPGTAVPAGSRELGACFFFSSRRRHTRCSRDWSSDALPICGAIIEFENCDIEHLQEEVARRHGFTITTHKLELYGLCSKCKN